LLIVTADHDHYLTLNPNYPTLVQNFGGEALTNLDTPGEAGHFWGSDPNVKYGWGNHSNRPVPVYYQGAGADVLNNNDTVYSGSGVDKFILDVGEGAVTIYGFSSNDQISRGTGLKATDALTTSFNGSDILISFGNDLLATLKFASSVTIV
jgi:alkaline phosphatase